MKKCACTNQYKLDVLESFIIFRNMMDIRRSLIIQERIKH